MFKTYQSLSQTIKAVMHRQHLMALQNSDSDS